MSDPSTAIVVTVPPVPDMVHVLRAVTGAVGATMEIPVDALDDLRLAVDEASSYLLTLQPRGSRLRLSLTPSATELRAVVSVDVPSDGWPAPGFPDSLSWKVISGLVDSVETATDGGGPAIVVRKRTLGPTP
jgi:serine/threonine-protein kinase RsbW